MKNHISFCVNNSKRLTFCFVNELQDVLRFLHAKVFKVIFNRFVFSRLFPTPKGKSCKPKLHACEGPELFLLSDLNKCVITKNQKLSFTACNKD